MSNALLRSLLHGEKHFLVNRAPGGVWFFVGLGLLGGLILGSAAFLAGQTSGWLVFHIAAAAFGVLFVCAFGTIALSTMRLERKEGKHVFMGQDGFYFNE